MAVIQEKINTQELTSLAFGIRSSAVEQIQGEQHGSPLRAMAHLYGLICEECERQNVPEELHPLNFTIGSIDPRTFGRLRNGNEDPLEADYAELAEEMALDPNSPVFARLLGAIQENAQQHWSNEKEATLTSYDPKAQGSRETRERYLRELENLGLKEGTAENAFLCYGGMDGIIRATRALVHLSSLRQAEIDNLLPGLLVRAGLGLEDEQLQVLLNVLKGNFEMRPMIEFGFPVPGFTMAINAAAAEGVKKVELVTDASGSFFFPPQEIPQVVKEHPNMEVVMITPFQNPTSLSADPDKLREFLDTAVAEKPSLKFMFDMAYLEIIEPEVAGRVMEEISDSRAYENSVFIFSRSKARGQPRLRSGMIYTPNSEIRDALAFDTMRGFPSFSWLVDLYDRALSEYLEENPQVNDKYRALLRKRQHTLLSTLKEMNSGEDCPIFENLDEITVPGYEDNCEDEGQSAQVPLYFWIKLREGVTAWDLAEQHNIIAVPGSVFGGTDDWVRFSVGSVCCSDMQRLMGRLQNSRG